MVQNISAISVKSPNISSKSNANKNYMPPVLYRETLKEADNLFFQKDCPDMSDAIKQYIQGQGGRLFLDMKDLMEKHNFPTIMHKEVVPLPGGAGDGGSTKGLDDKDEHDDR